MDFKLPVDVNTLNYILDNSKMFQNLSKLIVSILIMKNNRMNENSYNLIILETLNTFSFLNNEFCIKIQIIVL